MSDAKAAWEQVGSTFSGLTTKLRLHYEQARAEESGSAPPDTSAPPGASATPGAPAPPEGAAPPAAADGVAPPGASAGEQSTGPAYAPPTEPGGGTAAAGESSDTSSGTTREEAKEALRKLGAAIDDAFEALGAAAKDPAIKEDVRHVGKSLTNALSATFADVSEDLRGAFHRRKGDEKDGDPGDDKTEGKGDTAG